MDYIIVGGKFHPKEILTCHKISVFPDNCVYRNTKFFIDGNIKGSYVNDKELEEHGFQLFTLSSDYNKKNRITEEVLDNYIEYFEYNGFKSCYDKIKEDKIEKKRIKEKIKFVRGKYE